jgi:hypothetical protein
VKEQVYNKNVTVHAFFQSSFARIIKFGARPALVWWSVPSLAEIHSERGKARIVSAKSPATVLCTTSRLNFGLYLSTTHHAAFE